LCYAFDDDDYLLSPNHPTHATQRKVVFTEPFTVASNNTHSQLLHTATTTLLRSCCTLLQVVFTEPFTVASNNDYNPLIEAEVAALQADPQAKVASALLKERFVSCAEALLHGDLHTGSLMVTGALTVDRRPLTVDCGHTCVVE
jgi:hypothetical protein